MSQFQRRYTDRQKRAVGIAQLDGGMSAQDAVAALAAGTLTDHKGTVPAGSHPMPKSTAHDCARRIRQDREGRRGGLERASADAARAELNARLTFAADRLTKRVERAARNGTAPDKLAVLLTKAATAVAAVHRATAEVQASKPPPTTNGKQPTTPTGEQATPAPLDDIAADIEREDRAAARAPANASAPHA